jgi:Fanconi anemia group M protein
MPRKKMFVMHPLIKGDKIKLRKYQELVVSRAIDANTLVVLPTGLGKTIIAAMVSAHRLYKIPNSKVLFLAPTKPLVVQHQKKFSEILNINIPEDSVLTGIIPVKERRKIFDKNRIIFATPQTIENDIARGLNLKNVSLIIFDEGHRAVGNYSYVFIAREYVKKAKEPLILGLTASPSSNNETVKEICNNLFIQRIEAKTDYDKDVKPYIQKVKTEWIRVELPEEFKKVKILIEELLREKLKELKVYGYLKSAELKRINKRTLLKIQAEIRNEISQGLESFEQASIVASAIKINHALELVETQGISSLDSYLERLKKQRSKAIKTLFADDRMKKLERIVHELNVLKIDHPKLDELVKIIKENKDKKIIIFTQYRDSVEKIIEKLNEHDLLAREFIGQASRGDKKGMTQKEQINVLENFKEGKYDALVATSVAEEGLDIPKVDLVIFYEPIPSEIRAIQRRGRTGRTEAGKVIILMAKNTRDEGYYWASYHKEKKMGKIVREMREKFEGSLGQKSLLEYRNGDIIDSSFPPEEHEDEKTEKAIKIYVDSREKNSKILEILRETANVEIKQLEVGDFIVSEKVGVERKRVEDFLQSIIDKRLFNQAEELSRNFEIPILIIEGYSSDLYSLRDIHANAIRGAIISLALDFGIFIIPTRNEEDTGNFLCMIARREQLPEFREIPLRGERKPLTLEEKQRYIIESLPNVSAVLAKRLLEKFRTIRGVINASKKELMQVEGIGEGKAKQIKDVVRAIYGGKRGEEGMSNK